MGDYEKLCDQMGLNPGSEEDYEKLFKIMVHGRGKERTHSPSFLEGDKPRELIFGSFHEACEWSKNHSGSPFTRSADGRYFIPMGSKYADHEIESFTQVQESELRAFLKGAAAPGVNWLPGTYVGIADAAPNKALFERDQLLEKQYFLPRLSALAPRIANEKIKGKYSVVGLGKLMSSPFHTAQSLDQVKELLDLLEGKLVRAKRWYATQAAEMGGDAEFIKNKYQEIPSHFQAIRKLMDYQAKFGKVPIELYFWQAAVEVVREEYAVRAGKISISERRINIKSSGA